MMDRGTAYNIISGLATVIFTIVFFVIGVIAFAWFVIILQDIWSDFWALLT